MEALSSYQNRIDNSDRPINQLQRSIDQALDILVKAKELTAIANLLNVRPESIPRILERRRKHSLPTILTLGGES